MAKIQRSARVVLTPEAKVLRNLRIKRGLSMPKVASALDCSTSLIAHIETGRLNPPKGDGLHRFLKLYGDIKPKYFQELCKNWRDEKTDADVIQELLNHLSPEHLKIVRGMVEQMAQKKF